ncbi:MAG: hypothetical protein HXY27_07465 [Hydrogenophilaceae bacterium]|nr:hypothetical protein [Hydrogenophilaceae bacterium]
MKCRDAKTQRKILMGFSCASLAFSCSGSPADETHQSVSSETGLMTWETKNKGVHLRLTQISSDQARAFMLARGMDTKSASEFADTCVYMTVLRNDSKQPIKYSLSDWRYVEHGGKQQPMLTKHDWLARWQPRKFGKPVMIAFAWSQFPVEQTFSPGDWNQGMTTFDLSAGSRFDVRFRWRQNGRVNEGILENVQCAARAE